MTTTTTTNGSNKLIYTWLAVLSGTFFLYVFFYNTGLASLEIVIIWWFTGVLVILISAEWIPRLINWWTEP
ncbi:MAG: hypothetical protein IH840_00110 [Candidatus Heimdallarchaeota archaeon]|nr:hypothetical protein [Candidatus Heimdallarchaeota archaeon]